MKKIIVMVAVVAMLAMTVISASAAGLSSQEQKILDAIKQDIPTASGTLKVPAQYLTQVENFLLSDDSITAEDADKILASIDEAKALVKDQSVTKFGEIPTDIRNKVVDIATDAAKIVDAEVEVSGNSITITKDGKAIFEASMKNSNPIKQTDAEMTGMIVAGAVLVCGLAFMLVASRKFAVNK